MAAVVTVSALLCNAPAAHARLPLEPAVRADALGAYSRIIFDWPQKVQFRADLEGEALKIHFSEPLKADFSGLLANLNTQVTKAGISKDGQTVFLYLKGHYRIRTFISGNLTGIDLIPEDKPRVEEAAAPKPEKKQPVAAETRVAVRFGAHEGFGRAVFEWPGDIKYRVSKNGAQLLVEFDKMAEVDMPGLPASVRPYFQSVSYKQAGDHLMFSMQVPANGKLTHSKQGKKIVIDISGGLIPAAEAPKTEEEMKIAMAIAARPVLQEAKEKEPEKKAPTPAPVAAEEKKPEAPKQAAITFPVPVPKPVREQAAAEPATPAPAAPAVAEAKTAAAPASPPPAVMVVGAKNEAATPAAPAPDKVVQPQATKQDELGVYITETGKTLALHFPWKERVGAAVFTSGDGLWAVFDKKTPLNLEVLKAHAAGFNPHVLDDRDYTILYMTNPSGLKPSTKKQDFEWIVELSPEARPPVHPVDVMTVMQSSHGPHVFLSVLQTAERAAIKDPMVGDVLEVVPTYNPGDGMAPGRSFIEFQLLETAQGVAIRKFSDGVKTTLVRNGIRLTQKDGGLHLSENMPLPGVEGKGGEEKPKAAATLFPYREWKAKPEESYRDAIKRLTMAIVNAKPEDRNDARLNLAEFFLAEGMAQEATAVLSDLIERAPAFAAEKKLYALRGASQFMMQHLREAQFDFGREELNEVPEVDFWRRALRVFMGEPDSKFEYLANEERYIQHYPPKLRQQLALLAADERIRETDYHAAKRIFESLERAGQIAPVERQVKYMMGKIQAETGKTGEAQKTWEELAQMVEDRFVRARAAYSLTALKLNQEEISRADAVKEFDKLRIVWRGDSLELSLLSTLGQLYIDEGHYLEGMKAWREVVTNFPSTMNATLIAQKMTDTFMRLFLNGEADRMQPLDALALYYEFRELTPVGEQGDVMIRNLADRLAKVDLLDRAAALLVHQVRFRLAGEERTKVGTQLALLHLLNKKPKLALEALDGTEAEGLSRDIADRRRYLRARALSDLGEHGKALALIDGDLNEDAQLLAIDINWNKKDWPQVIRLIQKKLVGRELSPEPLNEMETELMVRLATAYTLDNYIEGLDILHTNFSKLMREGKHKEVFDFLTQHNMPVSSKDFATITKDVEAYESFLGKMRGRIQQEGLDSAVN